MLTCLLYSSNSWWPCRVWVTQAICVICHLFSILATLSLTKKLHSASPPSTTAACPATRKFLCTDILGAGGWAIIPALLCCWPRAHHAVNSRNGESTITHCLSQLHCQGKLTRYLALLCSDPLTSLLPGAPQCLNMGSVLVVNVTELKCVTKDFQVRDDSAPGILKTSNGYLAPEILPPKED